MFKEVTATKWIVILTLAVMAGIAAEMALRLESLIAGGFSFVLIWIAYGVGVWRTYRQGVRPEFWEKSALGGMLMTAAAVGFLGVLAKRVLG